MDERFGNIPDEILTINVNVDEYDRDYVPLWELIAETTDEPIEHAEWHVENSKYGNNEQYFISFTAWTQNHVLILIRGLGMLGEDIIKVERNYKSSSFISQT